MAESWFLKPRLVHALYLKEIVERSNARDHELGRRRTKLSMNDSRAVWALSKLFRFTEDIIEESPHSRYEKKRSFWKD
ncbi:hypothetical protein [Peribacillus frigoritolerans]|uniref:hypothetical protein n=1 Tax=Peribacillus frigoritolerans TaxID=450367 RepID=UPI0023DC3E79|nr:hypothetical protein [Peribacillus frigoritolerans]MDF2000309.1 hypothetical protein [Peribacillus frigoritolerans]